MSGPPLPPDYYQPTSYAALRESPRTGMAIAALVCGIVGIAVCMPVGIVGLILGIIATTRASREPERYGGKGLAIAGICTGGVSLLMIPVIALMISMLLPSLARAREITKRAVDASNLRGIGQAMLVYAHDNDHHFPPDFQALLDDGSITAQQLTDPSSANLPPRCDYYYVVGLTSDDPADWIVAYCDPANHGGEGANILYVNGRVEFVKEPGFTQEIEGFQANYEKSRGQPPSIAPPQ